MHADSELGLRCIDCLAGPYEDIEVPSHAGMMDYEVRIRADQ
jgi:hypothetical protein